MSDTAPNDLLVPAVVRSRRQWWLFGLGLWTVFVVVVVWWLLSIQGAEKASTWTVQGGQASSVWERTRDWLRVMHVNFQRIYPWILLAPYVLWLTSHFYLERGRFALSVAVQLAGCTFFALAAHAMNARLSTTAKIVVIGHTDVPSEMGPEAGKRFMQFKFSSSGPGSMLDEREVVTGYHTQLVVAAGVASGSFPTSLVAGLTPAPLRFMPTNLVTQIEEAMKPGASARFSPRPLATLMDVLAYGALAGLAHSVHFYRRYRERERRALFLESNLTRARLHALQAQLQPHFLFNTLNAIATLLRRDVRAAEKTLMSLSELLRLALSRSQEQEISLHEELGFLERYVQIQQTRFGERLKFELEVEDASLDCLVPTLTLQPLVENAVQHGIEPTGIAGVVRVSAHRNQQRLVLKVTDSGAGLEVKQTPGGGGIGLSNLRERLSALYAGNHKLEIISPPEGGTSVQVEVPWHTTQIPDQPA